MGKGDIRTRRGKIWRGTTGVTRPRKKTNAIRPAVPTRKVKAMKDIKAVAEPIVKKIIAESIPVVETVQPVIQGVTAEVPQIVSEPIAVKVETKKAPAKKVAVKKAPVAKKPAAKKLPAKKKK